MSTMRAGAAERIITPPLGTPLAGYFEPHYAQEVVADIRARALAVEDEAGRRAAIVACDVLAVSAESVAAIRTRVERDAGIPAGNVLVCATHTHTGPQTAEIFGQPPHEPYMRFFEEQVAGAVTDAMNRRAPARLTFGTAQEDRININRRVVMRDGTVHTHTTDADADDEVGREGPSDPEVAVLAVEGDDGRARALLVNYALHPTNVRGDRICPDYPGYLAEILRPGLTGEAVTVFANGACGNLDSKTPFLRDVAYGPGRAQRIAEVLAEAVERARAESTPLNGGGVGAARQVVRLPLKEVSPELLEQARAILNRDEPGELVFTKGTRRPSAHKERIYAAEALRMAELRSVQPYFEAEVQLIRIGDIAVVGLPVELFTEFGLEIKRIAQERFRHALVIELANGYFGYVPTRKAFEGGGYETRLARSSPVQPESGDLLVEAAAKLLNDGALAAKTA